jgi:hypothetical protein
MVHIGRRDEAPPGAMESVKTSPPTSVDRLLEILGETLDKHHGDRDQRRARDAPDFNPYLYARLGEVGLSTVIGDLLNPAGTHGQGSSFLAQFLKLCDLEDLADGCEHANVRLEHGTRGLKDGERRRIDILIHGKSWVVGIENKPWADDQDLQVSDYLRYLRGINGSRFHLLYLTTDGSRPREHSIDEQSCATAIDARELLLPSYTLIAKWIEACADTCRAEGAKWFLKYLHDHVNRVVLGKPPDEVNKMLLKTVLEPAHLPAVMQLLQARDAIRNALIRQLTTAIRERLPKGWKLSREQVDDVVLGIDIPGIIGGYFAVELEDGGRCFYGFKREKNATEVQGQALDEVCARM